jgi:hypothetical protein
MLTYADAAGIAATLMDGSVEEYDIVMFATGRKYAMLTYADVC